MLTLEFASPVNIHKLQNVVHKEGLHSGIVISLVRQLVQYGIRHDHCSQKASRSLTDTWHQENFHWRAATPTIPTGAFIMNSVQKAILILIKSQKKASG